MTIKPKRLLKELEGSDDYLGFEDKALYDNPYDNPVKPPHYNEGNDVYQFCLDNDLGGLEMNVIKYVSRWKKKNGIEDLRKARETLDRLIQYNVE